jgi:hypothetical protein
LFSSLVVFIFFLKICWFLWRFCVSFVHRMLPIEMMLNLC